MDNSNDFATGYAVGRDATNGGGYGNNNPSGFAPKSAPAPTAAPAADLDDDLPF